MEVIKGPDSGEISIAITELEGGRLSFGGHVEVGTSGWLARVKTIFDALETPEGERVLREEARRLGIID